MDYININGILTANHIKLEEGESIENLEFFKYAKENGTDPQAVQFSDSEFAVPWFGGYWYFHNDVSYVVKEDLSSYCAIKLYDMDCNTSELVASRVNQLIDMLNFSFRNGIKDGRDAAENQIYKALNKAPKHAAPEKIQKVEIKGLFKAERFEKLMSKEEFDALQEKHLWKTSTLLIGTPWEQVPWNEGRVLIEEGVGYILNGVDDPYHTITASKPFNNPREVMNLMTDINQVLRFGYRNGRALGAKQLRAKYSEILGI